MLSGIWSEFWGRPVWTQELDSTILVGPFQLRIFYDSMSLLMLCLVHTPSVRVVSAVGLSVTCNSDHGLKQFKSISITVSTPGAFIPG